MAYNNSLGKTLTEYYHVSDSGFKTLIGVSHGFLGGFVFNTEGLKCAPLISEARRKIYGRSIHGGYFVDSDNNIMEARDVLDFAAYSRGREPTEGSSSPVETDPDGFMFGAYRPRFLRKIN